MGDTTKKNLGVYHMGAAGGERIVMKKKKKKRKHIKLKALRGGNTGNVGKEVGGKVDESSRQGNRKKPQTS